MRITSFLPRRRKTAAYALYAAAAVLLSGSLALAGIAGPARADDSASGWGSGGVLPASDSTVTVRWDNGGATPAEDRVDHGGGNAAGLDLSSQTIPHTGGKHYADANATLSTDVKQDFGDLSVAVSKTTGLQHQSVNITATGAAQGTLASRNSLVAFQCWGDADESQPDPQKCQIGGSFVDTTASVQRISATLDQASMFADGGYRNPTTIALQATQLGDHALLTSYLQAIDSINGFYPSDAAGQVVFFDANGNTVGTVPVHNAFASLTLTGSADVLGSTFTAEYLASDDEKYLDASSKAATLTTTSTPLTVPTRLRAAAGWNSTVPFQPVGATEAGAVSEINQYFTGTTTNAVGDFEMGAAASDTVSHLFEMQTGAESSGLGCGYRADQASTSVCWLVIVPADAQAGSGWWPATVSPLTPSLWAQRLQVKLGFADVATSCGAGARAIALGSEVLQDAITSWAPSLCANGVNLGYIVTGDDQARQQYSAGSASLIFTSQPVDDDAGGTSTLYAPVGLTAVTVSVLARSVTTWQPITGIKLDARLLLKLLTESYTNGIDQGAATTTQFPWISSLSGGSLLGDPEFRALNPTVSASNVSSLGNDAIVTLAGSDASTAVWQWILADPDAKAFLDGCPDEASNNAIINPFYSLHSYAECPAQAAALEAKAAAWRTPQSGSNPSGSQLPDDYLYTTPSYPPVGAAFALPSYWQRPAVADQNGTILQTPLTLADRHPRENTFAAIANDVLRGQEKTEDQWCNNVLVCGFFNPPGKWFSSTLPQYGSGVMGLTDGTAAAKDLLPTALLCDDTGRHCAGADNASLTAAANSLTPSATDSHFLQAPANPDYAHGAYPLTLPVYAEINTTGLAASDAASYAAALSYISGAGQQQGYSAGQLPPGMTPLTDRLTAQTASAVQILNGIAATTSPPPASDTPSSTPAPTPTDSGTSTPSPSSSSQTPTPVPTYDTSTLAPGEQFHLHGTGYQPGSYTVWLHSTPVRLGGFTVGANGVMDFTGTIPAGTTPGAHEIQVKRGSTVVAVYPVIVTAASTPSDSGSTAPAASLPEGGTPTPTPAVQRVPVEILASKTPAVPHGLSAYGIGAGLLGGVAAAVAAPLIGRRRRVHA